MNLNMSSSNSVVWKLFFVSSGFINLVAWNSLINLAEYFEKGLGANSFSLIAFLFFFGQLASFLTSYVVFKKLKLRVAFNFAFFMLLATFFLLIFFAEFTTDVELNKLCVIITAFCLGYICSFFGSKSFALAAQSSSEDILFFSFGTGLAGILTNIFAVLVAYIYPTTSDNDEIVVLRQQVIVYLIMMAIAFSFYLIVKYEFQLHFCQLIDRIESGEKDIEHAFSEALSFETKKTEEEWRIVHIIKWLLIKTTITYIVTIIYVVYFNVKCFLLFDDNKNSLSIAYYMFFFNVFDTVGKMLPESLTIKRVHWALLVAFLRSCVVVSTLLVTLGVLNESFASSWVRIAANAFMGFTNGLITNSTFGLAANRFRTQAEKGKAEFLILFSIMIGVFFGSLFAVILNDFNIGF